MATKWQIAKQTWTRSMGEWKDHLSHWWHPNFSKDKGIWVSSLSEVSGNGALHWINKHPCQITSKFMMRLCASQAHHVCRLWGTTGGTWSIQAVTRQKESPPLAECDNDSREIPRGWSGRQRMRFHPLPIMMSRLVLFFLKLMVKTKGCRWCMG